MAETNSTPGRKRDWTRVESIIGAGKTPPPQSEPRAVSPEDALVPIEQFDVPSPVLNFLPDSSGSQGILVKWRAKQLSRKAALEALEIQYNSQLDVLKDRLAQTGKVEKTRVAVRAEEYIKILDAKHLEVLSQLGMRNAATRWKAVEDLTDMAVAKINEVQEKNWPDSLINETIDEILALRKRVATEIMKELGIEHS